MLLTFICSLLVNVSLCDGGSHGTVPIWPRSPDSKNRTILLRNHALLGVLVTGPGELEIAVNCV